MSKFKTIEPLMHGDIPCAYVEGRIIEIDDNFTYAEAISLIDWLARATGHYPAPSQGEREA